MTMIKLFLTFLKIGVLGYGGGLAIIALVYDSIQQFGTITEEEFANWVAITQVTPGPVGLNIATFTGYGAGGILGSIVATLGVAIPAFVIVTLVCKVLFKYMSSWGVQGALTGVRPATIGLVGTALVTLVKPAIISETHIGSGICGFLGGTSIDCVAIAIIAASVFLIMKKKVNPIIVLLIMGAVGAILQA